MSLLSPLTGIGRYTYEISKRLQKSNDLSLYFFYGYYSSKLIKPSDQHSIKKLKSFIVKNQLIKKIVRKFLFSFSAFFSSSYDIYWQPGFVLNNKIDAKKIITTVHDFSFILYPNSQPKERREYLEKNFFKNIYKSNIIITCSYFTKQEVIERLHIDEDKIKVIYHGVDHDLFYVHNDLKLEYDLPKKFILCVGSIEPRKNLLGLLKAYENLDEEIKKEYKLVLVGFKGWENKEIMELINKNKDNIIYLGFICDSELAKVYNLATLFIFPSFYEGFGIPPLEAMACGTPVIASNTSCIPEICGDAVVYIDPHSIDDISKKIELLIVDKKLQKELVYKGLKKAKEYTWEKSVQKHLSIMKSL
ncbi:MAG: glycosyl transferase family 1 [Arcobacter sp.]|nr:MAG: glycosyl transferase family 1 [Arcobacter sp.]